MPRQLAPASQRRPVAAAREPLTPGPPSAELLDWGQSEPPRASRGGGARAWAALKLLLLAGFLAAAAAAAVLLAAAAVYAAFQRAGS